jgi:hypothetical protein
VDIGCAVINLFLLLHYSGKAVEFYQQHLNLKALRPRLEKEWK